MEETDMVRREEFVRLIGRLAQQLVDAPDTFAPAQRNEEWTKINFILPLLEGLGWDRLKDVSYEKGSQDVEGWLDFILMSRMPIGIEAKALDVNPPEDRSHPHIKKGLKQSKERGASYFLWTNGDCWQFFSLALPDAPMYDVTLSNAHDNLEQTEHIASEFQVIEKGTFTANPKLFDEAIREKWKRVALPAALHVVLKDRTHDLLQLVRQVLPSQLGIEDEEILSFFKALKPPDAPTGRPKKRMRQAEKSHSFPEDWQKLLNSFEPEYDRASRRFREGYYRKLAQYLIGDQCSPWSKSTTWRHVGTPKDRDERKKLGPVISLFREWHFIEDAEGVEMYQRVEKSVPYLKKLLEKPVNP
jgi:hypothetical protein